MSNQLHISPKSRLLETLLFKPSQKIFALIGVVWLLSLIAKFGAKKPNITSVLPFGVLIYHLLSQARVPESDDDKVFPP